MLTQTHDNEEIIARVAALDIGKAELVCCVRIPDKDRPGRRRQEVETYSTMTRPLLCMADHLRCLGVTRVVMETSGQPSRTTCWRPKKPKSYISRSKDLRAAQTLSNLRATKSLTREQASQRILS